MHLIHNKTTFLVGEENIFCRLRDGYKEVSHSEFPRRNCVEEYNFGNSITAKLFIKCQTCPFIIPVFYKRGELEVFIIKVFNLSEINRIPSDPFVKVFLNGEKIYKTDKRLRNSNPIFNESFKINVQKEIDLLAFHVYSHNTISSDSLLCHREFPLFNIPNGYSRFDIKLNEQDTKEESGSSIQLIFNFKNEYISSNIKEII